MPLCPPMVYVQPLKVQIFNLLTLTLSTSLMDRSHDLKLVLDASSIDYLSDETIIGIIEASLVTLILIIANVHYDGR